MEGKSRGDCAELTVQTGFGVSDHILATLMNVIIRNGAMMAGIMLTQLLVTLLYVHVFPFFGCDTPQVLPRRTSKNLPRIRQIADRGANCAVGECSARVAKD